MPALVASYQEKVMVTKLKKVYSVLSQAYVQAVSEYGTPDNWGLVGKDSSIGAKNMTEIFKQYLKSSPAQGGGQLYLADGQLIEFYIRSADCTLNRGSGNLENVCAIVSIEMYPDIAASKKRAGENHFDMHITKNAIVPHGTQDDEAYSFEEHCLNFSNTKDRFGCSAWVIYNENMDYLHCDHLSWGGKTKCN